GMAERQRLGDDIAGAYAGIGRRRFLDLQDPLYQFGTHFVAGEDVTGAGRANTVGVLQARRVGHDDAILVDGRIGDDAGDDNLRLGVRLDAVEGGRDLLAAEDHGRVDQVRVRHN